MQNSDFYFGMRDAASGYFDKWYRYNRKDEGAQYFEGWKSIQKDDTNIIDYNH